MKIPRVDVRCVVPGDQAHQLKRRSDGVTVVVRVVRSPGLSNSPLIYEQCCWARSFSTLVGLIVGEGSWLGG